MKPVGDTDKKQGRFSVETSLKRQKYVVHGFEARALKHIPKLVFKICERLLKLSNSQYYSTDMENFTRNFVAYKYDVKGGKMAIGQFKKFVSKNGQKSAMVKGESSLTTRRSSNR